MFDFHAHDGEDNDSAFISIVKKSEIPSIDKGLENTFYSLGHLPWFSPMDMSTIAEMLKNDETFSIGETGLDKRYGNAGEQLGVFMEMLSLAKEYDRIVVIHSVGRNEQILKSLTDMKIKRAIFHSYTSSYQSAREITRKGYFISLNERALKTRDYEKLLTLPFLLETDLPTGKEQKEKIRKLYEEVSLKTGIDQEKRLEDIRKEIWQQKDSF